MKNRLRISLVLMLVSMVLLAAFQVWWLRKSYKEEKETLDIRTSILFRETLYGLQASKLKLDSNLTIRMPARSNAVGVVNTVLTTIDTFRRVPVEPPQGNRKFVVTVDRTNVRRDSGRKSILRYTPDRTSDKIFDVLLASESPKDTLKIAEIEQAFNRALAAQQINVPYSVERKAGVMLMGKQINNVAPTTRKPEVSVGFLQPITYKLILGNTFPYLMKQITPEMVFALFLLTVTIISFLMLYRNLVAQKRLAGIKNEFISNITHELKTPIATVSVAIEALKNFNALHDPQRTKEYLDISQNELQRLSLLVDKVLKLSMFENKAIELKPEELNLGAIVEDVASSMRLQLEKYKAQISIEAQGDTTVKGDKLHLTSVVFNLLDNALKYSKAYPS
ncbi:MAG TPA: HAMP domain-containing sensor histidine kinase, partial [Chitinophagaceae bacterium]|nr:HAMP domain-containing sensor histidine kinase [Chitinophagaceae bacterium]